VVRSSHCPSSIFICALFVLGLFVNSLQAAGVSYLNFSSTAGLNLVGSTATAIGYNRQSVLRLTLADGGQSGAAWSTSAISFSSRADTFSTFFQFQITNPDGIDPADGIVFALQPVSAGVGGVGGSIGYGGVTPSVGIEFDTYQNAWDPNSNHIGVDEDGSLVSVVTATPYGIGNCTSPVGVTGCMANGHLWSAWIDYNGTTLTVSVADNSNTRPSTPLLSYKINVACVLGGGSDTGTGCPTPSKNAFVGFTSGTGAGWENHDIVDWQYTNAYAPISGRATTPGPSTASVRMLSGAWLEADGRRHLVEQSGTALSWTVEDAPGIFRGDLHGRDFQVSLQPNPGINGTSIIFDRIHGIISLDGLTVQTSEYHEGKLIAETTLVRLSISAQDKPDRLGIQVEKPSTLAGQPILAQVVVKTRDGVAVPADREYKVDLTVNDQEAKPGVLSSSHLVVHPGNPSAPFTITADRPGETKVSAQSDPHLVTTPRLVYACGSGAIRAVELSSGANEGPADGKTPIGFTLKLTDGNGHLTTDFKTNTISIQRKGVGMVDRDSVELPGDQCISERAIESAQPGSATVLAKYGPQSAKSDFFFNLPLSVLLFALVAAGGVGGELIRLSADYSRRRRWGARRLAVDGLAAILAGIAVFLAYYYGLLQISPRLTGGMGLGFLLGLIGGYLGPAAMNRISGVAVPGTEEKARGKGPDTSG
jgi:hypothetical protein